MQYSRKEMKLLKIFVIYVITSALLANTVAVLATPNQFHLPYNFYTVFLPFQGPFSFSWAINYCLEIVASVGTIIFFFAYFPALMFILNHSAWLVDLALLEINGKNIPFDIMKLSELVSKIAVWQITSQRLLLLTFLVEFNFLSLTLTLAVFSLSNNIDDSIPAVIAIMIMLMQLFSICWLGNQADEQLVQLAAALYNIEWYVLKTNQQKDLMLLILMTRNIRRFHGVFKKVNLVSCVEVKNFSIIVKFT